MVAKVFGWVGKMLRVNLSEGKIEEEDTMRYAPSFIGGRGIATKIAWEEVGPEVKPFDPENPLMFLTGPLTGTTAPCSGRTTICSVSPQAYPKEWFTRSSVGGYWGADLKYAGYDGLIVTGQAKEPTYLWIHDGQVELRRAKDLWGLGTYQTQQVLRKSLGAQARVLTIGQAGERLCRIAIINSETESAAGQGGFGAVMGSKKLKAVAVRGTGEVRVARSAEFLEKSLAIAQEVKAAFGSFGARLNSERAAKYLERFRGCSQQCSATCARYYGRVPGVVEKGKIYRGQFFCVAPAFVRSIEAHGSWNLGFEAGFEISSLANDYGLNHWEILRGIMPWLLQCKERGLLTELDGEPMDFDSPHLWAKLMRKIAYREGIGDALAEGGMRAAEILGLGKEFLIEHYLAWGQARHWDGHGGPASNPIVFPYWLVTALQWAMDSRDPMGSGHGYTSNVVLGARFAGHEKALTWEQMKAVAKKVYGTEAAADPYSGYEGKAGPAIWHGDRSALKDSLTICDNAFPRIFSLTTQDRLARAGDMEGPSFEYHLFSSATGLQMSKEEFNRVGERIVNLDRALLVRNHDRSRREDEAVIPYFEQPESGINPLLGKRVVTEREKFLRLMDEYYELREWDLETGRPLRRKLEELGLKEVADELERRLLLPDARARVRVG